MNIFPDASQAQAIYTTVRSQIPRLGLTHNPQQAIREVVSQLNACSDAELLGGEIHDLSMAKAVRAGLLLCADLDDESHCVSQEISTVDGSYWHGIMHRREPDYSNSKYWFRRVGPHPLFASMMTPSRQTQLVGPILGRLCTDDGVWDPFYFVDLCASCVQGPQGDLRETLEELQAQEIDALLAYCTRAALTQP